MTFLAPAFFLLALPCAALLLLAKGGRVDRVLRGCLYALLVLALARPATERERRNGTLVVVADRSASMAPSERAAQGHLLASASSRMRGGERLGVVAFAASAEIEQTPQAAPFSAFAFCRGAAPIGGRARCARHPAK